MIVQKYKVENIESFELKHIFECGQCFRWNENEDKSFTGVFGKNVLNVKKENKDVIFTGICNGDIDVICKEYFDLDRDYESIKRNLSKVDSHLKTSIEYGHGIRLLNQDLWEMIISYIISANNNIPRIKGIIEKLSMNLGDTIEFENKIYYTFPTPAQLSKYTVEDLRKVGLGFRDIRVFETTKKVIEKQVDLDKIKNIEDTNLLKEELLKLDGVGPKVADCILLFSTLKRLDVFPIDVWVRRVMNELYIKNEDESKVSKKQIEELAIKKFGDIKGIAQQYLFYWKRDLS